MFTGIICFRPLDWDPLGVTTLGPKTSMTTPQNEREGIPSNMPQYRGQGVTISAYVDSGHAGDTLTRRSRTGFLVFLNCALIFWNSKKQTAIETSSFGSEFTAMKQCTEYR